MKRHTLLGLLAAAGGGLAVLVWALAPGAVEVELEPATVGPFEATIDEDGKTRLADRYVVSAPLAARLVRITLREGDAVAAGAVVARLVPMPAPLLDERSTREATARVEGAQAQLQRASVRIERARVGLEQARLELRRSEQLARDGYVAPTKLDADRLAARAASQEVETAVQERHMAEHELEQARTLLSALRPGGGGHGRGVDVTSPVAGQVLRVLQTSEGAVAAGAPLLEVGNLDRLEVVSELLTTDALRATPGLRVRIERWGGSGELEGRVRRVEPAAFTKVSALGVEEQRVRVVIDLTSPRDRWQALGDGFRVAVRIVALSEARALRVPSSAVFPLPGGAEGAAAVFVVRDGRARQTPVTLRARNATAAWLAGGLEAGERVVVYPPAAVADGVRVRARVP